eukprot:gene22254-28367_t
MANFKDHLKSELENPSLAAPNRVNVDFMASTARKSQQEEQHIRTLGLEGLIIIIRSLGTSSGLANVSSKMKIVGTVDELIREKNKLLAGEAQKSPTDDLRTMEEDTIESPEHSSVSGTSVADFFRQYQDRLDKTAVGDYLGREREYEGGFCLKVLHEYVQSMDFTDMAFDMAIRYFLGGFRLPGEAQKIDRLMEKGSVFVRNSSHSDEAYVRPMFDVIVVAALVGTLHICGGQQTPSSRQSS